MAGEAENTVPYSRFENVNNRMQAAEGRATSLEAEIAALKRAAGEKDAAIAAANARAERVQVLARHGFADPEMVDLVEYSFSRLPEQGRPQLGTWLQTITADPAQAPMALRPHLKPPAGQAQTPQGGQPAPGQAAPPTPGQPPAGQAQTPQGGQPAPGQAAPTAPGQPLPPGNAGVVPQPHAAGAMTADQIMRMSDQDLLRALPGLMAGNPALARNPIIQALAAQNGGHQAGATPGLSGAGQQPQ